ncbi:3-oxoacyl-[acyl-carrier-protein] synthase 2 [Artemisia annua]|uniref:beta-ketoacyl-[acyl-carrier-protein] synthase I n=1 Tax=Artemisia annua TaxID=35608 RepID=A0A2U1KBX8_ARTAN|nr:3-oxoacyl-[acyl-carrier-protein] synthase 2 [Artemisia annua]
MEAQAHLQIRSPLVSTVNSFHNMSSPITVRSQSRIITTRRLQIFASHSSATAPKREKDAKKRVVITGMGLVSVFGNDVDVYYERLLAGESGISFIDRFDASKLTTRFAGQIRGFKSNGYIDSKTDQRLEYCQRYCIVAGKKALEDAALGGTQSSKVCNCENHKF